jgi:hypothetical protein
MSQGNEQARHIRTCKTLESVSDNRPVIEAADKSLKVPLQKRKEEAKQVLYLNRV